MPGKPTEKEGEGAFYPLRRSKTARARQLSVPVRRGRHPSPSGRNIA